MGTTTATRWQVIQNHSECPDGYPWAVVDDSNEVLGFFSAEDPALGLITAFNDNDDLDLDAVIESLGGKPKPGGKRDKRRAENPGGRTGKTAEAVEQPQTTGLGASDSMTSPQWRGVLMVEGSTTGDGREFAPDSITWPDPNEVTLTLQWQKESSHGGDHDVTVAVGRIDNVWRDNNKIMGEGRFDTHPDAMEAHRRMGEGMLNGTSIVGDDITNADVEYVYPEGTESEEDDLFSILFAQPEKIIFHSARLRATTLCDIPAFVEATIQTIDPSESMVASAALIETHTTDTTDESWDGSLNEGRLSDPLTYALANDIYAYVPDPIDGIDLAKTDCRFPHHEVDESGVPGAANLTACSVGIGIIHGGRGETPLSDHSADRRKVYEHLAKHLRDAGQEPPPYQPIVNSVVAHAWVDEWRPPATWFANPNLGQVMPIMITDQGRVYGYAAQHGECHLGYLNECIMVPRDDDFSRYLTGQQPLDDGTRATIGVITAGISHAPLGYSANRASDHYDNTDAQIAYVTAGYDQRGIWVAGAILPWAEERRVSALRATGQVSPDWRLVGGTLKMVGLLAVNESGYQTEKPRVRALVSSGQVQSLVASGMVAVQHYSVSEEELNKRALLLMRKMLTERVHKTTTEV
jgi:hypothetical protein